MLRQVTVATLLLAACHSTSTSHPVSNTPSSLVTAVFDPTTGQIPLPNDLAFLNPPNSVCPPPANTLPAGSAPACAQAELLTAFAGKFPSDQEVAITLHFTQTNSENGQTTTVAPDLDLQSFTPTTFFVMGSTGTNSGEVLMEPISPSDYVKSGDQGTLTLHHAGRLPWSEGAYSVLVRGGPNGIKTTDGKPVTASQAFALLAGGLDMVHSDDSQVNPLIALLKSQAFPAADMRFPHEELAIATTFQIAPVVTHVTVDPGRGQVPLPIDLLRDATTGMLTPLAACTLAGATLAADGTCPSPIAAGFQALDGFATTGAILAPTSELIDANTINGTTLQLYDLTDPAHPALVDPTTLILEPCEFTSGCGSPAPLSSVIALQPAGVTAGDSSSVFRTRPLKDDTDYAVVMRTDIHDKAGKPLGPGTVAKIVRFENPLVVAGHSALQGIDDATAAALDKMRLQLQPVFSTLAAGGIDASQVAMAYTFHTQTIFDQAVKLAALPYQLPADTAHPNGNVTAETPLEAFTKYGVVATIPSAHIDEVLEVDITTLNALDPLTGAFLSDPTTGTPEQIHVLIATPKAMNPKVPSCVGPLAPLGCACAPMMVFRHGLGRGRADMLTIADTFAGAGMVTVAIDAAKHGDRSFCTSGSTDECQGAASCTTSLPTGAQGDAHPPGTCGSAGFIKAPVTPGAVGETDGIPVVSGNYLVSSNFFRTRDTLRQDLIDEAQLIRALAFAPSGAPPTGHAVFDHMFARGVVIDPAKIYFSGQSLGAIQGAMDVATNPRISKAAFNAGGGTIVDLFTNSPAFTANTDALLASLGISAGTSAYLQFLVVSKTVLDPADPVNFAGHLTSQTLPNLLTPLGGNPDGSVPQPPKSVLTQIANCDQVVPNPFNLIMASNIPTSPLPPNASFFAPNATGTFQLFVTAPFDPLTFGACHLSDVEHGFLTDWMDPSLTLNAQSDLAAFVMTGTLPLSVQHQ